MKILTYNLFNGARSTYEQLTTFINVEQPDILCLQEANGWNEGTPSRVERFAQTTGFNSWHFGDSNTDFKLVTLSRLPVINSTCMTDRFWHSALKVVVNKQGTPLTIWNIHLDPRSPSSRLDETKHLIEIIGMPKNTIIAGDLNSLSRSDGHPADLANQLRRHDIQKFGTEKVSFDETRLLFRAGFTDAIAPQDVDVTVPTPRNKDKAHTVALRLDYILVSEDIAPLITKASVIKNDLTDAISDHYPVVATIE